MRTALLVPLIVSLLGCKIVDEIRDNVISEPGTPVTGGTAATPSSTVANPPPSAAPTRPDGFSLMKFAVGQHVDYRTAGNATKNRYAWAVVGEEGGAFWLQLISRTDGKDYVMHLLTDISDGSEIHNLDPKKMKFKIPGRGVQEISGKMMAMGKRMTNDRTFFLEMNPGTIAKGAREDVLVAAGAFSGAFAWTGKTKWQGKTNKTKFWSHPDVPITGIVKGDDGQNTWELTSYGKTGAKSEL